MAQTQKLTQNQRIMKHLSKGKALSPKQARVMYSITKPSARICAMLAHRSFRRSILVAILLTNLPLSNTVRLVG
jgi:hypothetical protein